MEIDLIAKNHSLLPPLWLSATEGKRGAEITLHRQLDHWPEFEDNQDTRLMAIETVWRDYYTGYRLDNWPKPYMRSTEDNVRGDTHQCMIALTGRPWEKSWIEWQCEHSGFSCPCSYPVRPLLRMRGRCSKSIEYQYSPM